LRIICRQLETYAASALFSNFDLIMTFSCKNFDFNAENCMKLNTDCIPGRPGCVLEGKVKFSEDIEKKLKELEAEKRGRERGAAYKPGNHHK